MAGVARGGGGGGGVGCVVHSLTRRSVKFDYSNFGQDVLWEKMNIFGTKNPDQIDNGVTVIVTSSLLLSKTTKTVYFKIAAASLSFIESY